MRERRLYDRLLGRGTYTFKLECRGEVMCVDASRRGNMAHLLNHSCAPNSFSATKTICFAAGASEHVVIVASRDIAPGEELTYNYRRAACTGRCTAFLGT